MCHTLALTAVLYKRVGFQALVDVPDQYIFKELLKGKEDNSFYKGFVNETIQDSNQGHDEHAISVCFGFSAVKSRAVI